MNQPRSTPDSRAAALTMFKDSVPCIFQLGDPACQHNAAWIAWFVHEENTSTCTCQEPWPVCDEHKRVMQATSHPFWRTWHQLPPLQCAECDTPMRVSGFERI